MTAEIFKPASDALALKEEKPARISRQPMQTTRRLYGALPSF
jgi:hypothetical protein